VWRMAGPPLRGILFLGDVDDVMERLDKLGENVADKLSPPLRRG